MSRALHAARGKKRLADLKAQVDDSLGIGRSWDLRGSGAREQYHGRHVMALNRGNGQP